MSSNGNAASPSRPAILEWLVRANAQVSQWAASTTWWRLILLFVVILVAGSLVSSKLGLRHDRIRVAGSPKTSS
jgi:cytochrome b561